MLETGRYASISEIATAEKIDRGYVGSILRLTLLAPDIIELILDGRQSPVAQAAEPPLLPLGDELNRPCRREMRDVQSPARERGELQVPGDDDRLGRRRRAHEAQHRGVVALVHLPSLSQVRVLRVLADHHVEGLRVLERQAHDA